MTTLGLLLLAVLVAAALAAATYFVGGTPPRALWPAVAGRGLAWGAMALLLVNLSCPAGRSTEAPLILLDASPSLDAAGAQGGVARQLADSLGEVRTFAGSRLQPALLAAAASGRSVVVVTDGEIADAAALSATDRAATTVHVLPRRPVDDLAIVATEGPPYVAQGDSLAVRADLRAFGTNRPAEVTLELRAGDQVLAQRSAPLGADGFVRVTLEAARIALPAGDHLLEVRIAGGADAEPRTDRRLHRLTVSATPGVVLVANPADWDARFLYRTLVDVSALPVQGYLMLDPGNWRRMSDLRPVATAVVTNAIRDADLLVTLGGAVDGAERSRARGRWEWFTGTAVEGDWYLAATGGSPLGGAFSGIGTDSLPPAVALELVNPPEGSWTGLTAQLGRRGALRPAVYGVETGTRRRLVVAASGLWRWSFRGGLSEQAYRGWVANSVTWLLGRPVAGSDALARPVRAVVEREEPVVFEWLGGDSTASVAVTLNGPQGAAVDTLVFDGAGRARLTLEPGSYRYQLEGGGSGLVAVESYSAEYLPSPVTLPPGEATSAPERPRRRSRDLPLVFLVAVVGWCVEWGARRRAGMR